jgi:DNA-binding response OmpR family regulator
VRLLVAEDDAKLREVLARGLERAGYIVDLAARGDDALDLLLFTDYAAAVVDWRMPGMEGIDVVLAARRRGRRVPVLMLTARDMPGDRVAALDAGSDDYLMKPFDFGELLARLRALLRRLPPTADPPQRFGGLLVDPARREASVDGVPLAMTRTELKITELLVRRAPATVTRRDITRHAWPDAVEDIGANTLEVHMARLRAKLVAAGIGIEAVPRIGYRLVAR